MASVQKLRAEANARDRQAAKEEKTLNKKSKGSHQASSITTHDTGFMKTGSSVGPGGSHDNISPTFKGQARPKKADSGINSGVNFCPGCGAKITVSNINFCASCGFKLN